MSAVLNPALYDTLVKQYGTVVLSSPGEGASIVEMDGRIQVLHVGEQYRVNCNFCNDTRQRLYVHHLWFEYRHLVHCFNEQCMTNPDYRQYFAQALVFNLGSRAVVVRQVDPPEPEDPHLSVDPPDGVRPITDFPYSDPAVQYLVGRGFDPAAVFREFAVGLCPISRLYPPMSGRLYTPVFDGSRMAGWQGRFVGDPPIDPATGKPGWKKLGVTKYYNRPGFRKSRYLYGPADQTVKYPFVVLVEGVTDTWRIGPAARGYLGLELSPQQRLAAVTGWGRELIVCMGDGEAHENNAVQADALAAEVAFLGGRVARVDLPKGVDPAKLTREQCWGEIESAAARVGYRLARPY